MQADSAGRGNAQSAKPLANLRIPGESKHIPVEVSTQVVEKTDVAAELENVVSEDFVQIVNVVVIPQFEFGFQGKLERPRNIWRIFALQDPSEDFVFLHHLRMVYSFK
jgi:hypothetical protein